MGAEMPGDSISVIMVVMKELLFPLLCSFRKFWGRTAGKVMSDWSAGCNSKGPAVSRFSERKNALKSWQIFMSVCMWRSKAHWLWKKWPISKFSLQGKRQLSGKRYMMVHFYPKTAAKCINFWLLR